MAQRRPARFLLAAAALVVAGCSGSLPASVHNAPVLSIATGLWPLAQLAGMIGGDKVAVVDVVPAGVDPIGFNPGSSTANTLRSAGLVLEVGGGFQPGIEAAAAGSAAVIQLSPLSPGDPYVWLDPSTTRRVVDAVVKAMSAADPQAAALFRRNGEGVDAQLQSLGIDFSTTFTACPGTTMVTPDTAFSAMAHAYGLHDAVIGPHPTPAAVATLVSALPANSVTAGVTEPWVDSSGVTAASSAGHFKVRQVSTLVSGPDGAAPAVDTYFAQMEQLLGQVSGALGCSAQEQ